MLETLEQNKKRWLVAILIVEILAILFIAKIYLYPTEEKDLETKLEIKEEILPNFNEEVFEKCKANFNLDKLDFAESIWESELPTLLKELAVLRAVIQDNRNLCGDYEKEEIDPGLHKIRCECDYDLFFTLTEKLKDGISSQQYVKECQEALIPNLIIEKEKRNIEMPEDMDILKEGVSNACESYYQSFQNKTPVILDPDLMCDKVSPSDDVVNYLDPKDNRIKSCLGEHGEKIKFLIAIAKNNPVNCLDIKDSRVLGYCQFYFDRKNLIKLQNEFREDYCHALAHEIISPVLESKDQEQFPLEQKSIF